MKNGGKILLSNLLILAAYFLVLKFAAGKNDFIGVYMMAILLHMAVAFVLAMVSFVQKQASNGAFYLLSCVVVLLVGFSSCIATGELNVH